MRSVSFTVSGLNQEGWGLQAYRYTDGRGELNRDGGHRQNG